MDNLSMLFRGHSPTMIKWEWGKFSTKIGKWFTSTIKYKKVNYSNSSRKLWIVIKYAIDLILVKRYKKRFIFVILFSEITNKTVYLKRALNYLENMSTYFPSGKYELLFPFRVGIATRSVSCTIFHALQKNFWCMMIKRCIIFFQPWSW